MEQIIDKYIRKRIWIRGKQVYCDISIDKLRHNVMDVFDLSNFSFHRWCQRIIDQRYCIHYTYDSTEGYCWFLGGQIHRTDGPARVFKNGSKWYYLNGNLYSISQYLNGLELTYGKDYRDEIDRRINR